MHELAITTALIEVVREEVERSGGGQVVRIDLTVSGFESLEPHSLNLCFEMMTEGTAMEGAVIEVKRLPIRIRCKTCDADRISDERFHCEICNGTDVVLLPSEPMRVNSVTVRR